MPIITLDNITLQYSGKIVLKEINWTIEEGEKIGLIGNNGTGKTSLFKIIVGEIEADSGEVYRKKDIKIGYLKQEPYINEDITLWDAMKNSCKGIISILKEMEEIEVKMAKKEASQNDILKYGTLQEKFEQAGGFTYESEIKSVLHHLGFEEDDYFLPVNKFSGGEKNRIALGEILLLKPNILLLDEPTNHLDIDMTKWLEEYLKQLSITYIVISHDRYFLDNTVNVILELSNGKLERYSGNYSFYFVEKKLREEQREKEYIAQIEKIKKTEDYIQRNIVGQKSRQAQSRRKMLEKMEKIERVYKEKEIKPKFLEGERSGKEVVKLTNVSMKYNSNYLFRNFTFTLYRGEKVGIIGPNGSGKTTLLKIITGKIAPIYGEAQLGFNTNVGYFDQELKELPHNLTILDFIWEVKPDWIMEQVRTFLGAFLFSGESVFKKIETLSGGEKNRVALAKLILSSPNFLALDEPTNHLDISSRVALEEALSNYTGTLLIVSHDRYLLDRVVNKILHIAEGKITSYLGNYSYYEEKSRKEREERERKEARVSLYLEGLKKYNQKEEEFKKNIKREKQKRVILLEKEINKSEEELKVLNYEINKTDGSNWIALNELYQKQKELENKINTLIEEWEIACKELERI